MKTNKLPTAVEFWENTCKTDFLKSKYDIMIEFAKLHVEAALQSAAENGEVNVIRNAKYGAPDEYSVNKQSILNSYSSDNIK